MQRSSIHPSEIRVCKRFAGGVFQSGRSPSQAVTADPPGDEVLASYAIHPSTSLSHNICRVIYVTFLAANKAFRRPSGCSKPESHWAIMAGAVAIMHGRDPSRPWR